MDKLKRWWKKFWCWITGGHTYACVNLQSCYDERDMMYTFRNRCCKCGKEDKWEVPAENLLPKKPSVYVFVEDEDGE